MGGSVGVTIRLKDGTEHRMCRWTNTLPWGIANERMLRAEPEPEHLANYLYQWVEMREDYAKNKESGNFEFNMTDCYAPWPLLAPMEYGLVVLDFMSGNLWSRQSYTSLTAFHCISLWVDNEFRAYRKRPYPETYPETLNRVLAQEPDGLVTDLKRWFDAKRLANPVRMVEFFLEDSQPVPESEKGRGRRGATVWKEVPMPQLLEEQDFGSFLLGLDKDDMFRLVTEPITYHEMRETRWRDYKRVLAKHDFRFTEEEEEDWAAAIGQEAEEHDYADECEQEDE